MLKEDWTHDAQLGQQFAGVIGLSSFAMWFPHNARLSATGHLVTIATDSSFLRDVVRTNMDDDLRRAAKQIFGAGSTVRYVVSELKPAGPEQTNTKPVKQSTQSSQVESAATKNSIAKPKLGQSPAAQRLAPAAQPLSVGGGSFDTFVTGEANRFAFEVARQVARRGTMGTPVTLLGDCGSGKSHLLAAIRDDYRRRFPKSRVLLLTAEQFTTGFLGALNGGGLPNFRQKHRGVDLLIVDNLPFFVGKRATIEELQYTIDTVLADGGQVVLASSKPLAELSQLGSEMISRCASGLTCDLGLPDAAARKSIISQLFARHETPVDEDVISVLASGLATGVREIMGVVNRLATQHTLLGDIIDRPLAERVVGQANRHARRPVKLDDIQRVVCDFFGVDGKALRSDDRHKSVSQPRMLAMWLARKYTQSAWREIGSYFGGRSHSTVISAHRRIETQLGRASEMRIAGQPWQLHEAIERLEAALRTG